MKKIKVVRLELDRETVSWIARVFESDDAGKTFHFTGIEKRFMSSEDEKLQTFTSENSSPLHTFPVITSDIQISFELNYTGYEKVPCICGYFGRACRQMDKPEGANRNLCNGCPLANYSRKKEMTEYAFS